MCDPASIGLALAIVTAGAGFAASSQESNAKNAAISAENSAKMESDMRARVSANEERDGLEDRARMENQRILEDAYENELSSRGTAAELLVSASGAGLNLAGSVVEAYDELNAAGARSEQNALEEMAQVGNQLESDKRGIKAKEASRIEENRLMPYHTGPSPLGPMLEIAGAGVSYGNKKGMFKSSASTKTAAYNRNSSGHTGVPW